jgi:hypothetical protein
MFFQDKLSISSTHPHLRLTQEDTIDYDFRKKEILLSNTLIRKHQNMKKKLQIFYYTFLNQKKQRF